MTKQQQQLAEEFVTLLETEAWKGTGIQSGNLDAV